MTPTLTFTCSICGDPSTQICVYCTKDACRNHRCIRCNRCSDCCECEVPLGQVDEPMPLTEEPIAEHAALEPMNGFNDAPPAPLNASFLDVVAAEPTFPHPPLEPDPAPAPEPFPPMPEPDPFPQPEPEPLPEQPVPSPNMSAAEAAPPMPHPLEPQPEPEPDDPAPATEPNHE